MDTKKRRIEKHSRNSNKISETRMEFYKRLFYMSLGIIPILFLYDNKGPERFLALAGFVFSTYHLIKILISLHNIVDDFYPPKAAFEFRTGTFETVIFYFSIALLFTSIACFYSELTNLDNTVHGLKLFLISALVSIALTIVITTILKKIKPTIYYESNRRITIYSGFFIGLVLLLPAAACLINRKFASGNSNCEVYVIQKKATSAGRANISSYLFLKLKNGNTERFEVDREFYNAVKESELIELCVIHGALGFDFATEFRKVGWQPR